MEQQILPALGQGDGDFAGDGVGVFPCVVEDFAFQNGDCVEQRHLFQHAGVGAGHVVVRDVRPGQNAVQRAVFVDHGDGGDGGVSLKFVPGASHGHAAAEDWRPVKIQIPHLIVQVCDAFRGQKSEAIQHDLGLVGDPPQAGRFILPIPAGVAQRRVGDGCHDGVRVRVPVAGNIDGIHKVTSLFCREGSDGDLSRKILAE